MEKKILVVDHNPTYLKLVNDLLKLEGFTVTIAKNAQEALLL